MIDIRCQQGTITRPSTGAHICVYKCLHINLSRHPRVSWSLHLRVIVSNHLYIVGVSTLVSSWASISSTTTASGYASKSLPCPTLPLWCWRIWGVWDYSVLLLWESVGTTLPSRICESSPSFSSTRELSATSLSTL